VWLCYFHGMNVPLTHAAEGLERRAFTVADVIRMVETDGHYRSIEAHEAGAVMQPSAIAGLTVNLGEYK